MTQIKLGTYKGVEIPKIIVNVSTEEVAEELERARQMAAKNIDVEKAENGDQVLIDFEGFLEGVPFEGGKGESYPLTLGSGAFIPGFEEQLVDAKKSDEVEVKVTFPNDYQAEDLAGKEAVFKVKVNAVTRQVLPELNDEFVPKVSNYQTLVELKNAIEQLIMKEKIRQEKQAIAKNKLMEACEVILKIEEIDQATERYIANMEKQVQAYGMNLEDYLAMSGKTVEDLKLESRGRAEDMLKLEGILDEISKLEDIHATEEEINGEIKGLARQYRIAFEQMNAMVTPEDRVNISKDIRLGKAFEYVMDHCVEI